MSDTIHRYADYEGLWVNKYTDHLAAVEKLEAENARLKAELAALQWRPITEQDLPQAEEEVGGPWGDGWRVDQVTKLKLRLYTTAADWIDEEYLYHRPIAPPADKAGA